MPGVRPRAVSVLTIPLFDRAQFIPLVAQWKWQERIALLPCNSWEALAADLGVRTRRESYAAGRNSPQAASGL